MCLLPAVVSNLVPCSSCSILPQSSSVLPVRSSCPTMTRLPANWPCFSKANVRDWVPLRPLLNSVTGGPELLLFAAACRYRRPDHLHRKGRRPARDRRNRAGVGRPPVGRLPDQVLGVVLAALLQRRPGQPVQLRQRLPGRDLPEGRRLHAMVGLLSRPPERLPQDAQARSMAVVGLEL